MRRYIYRLPLWLALIVMIGVGATGCSKIKEMFGKKEAPPEVSPYTPEEEARIARLREIAAERFAAAKQEAPAFNRELALKSLVKARYNVDLDRIFPDGYSEDKLGTIQDAQAETRQRALREAKAKFTDSVRAKNVEIAEQEFPFYETGDSIRVNTTGGRVVAGRVTRVTPGSVYVDGHEIVHADLLKPKPMAFDRAEVDRQREHYVRVHFELAARDYGQERYNKLYPGVLKEFGFVQDRGEWRRLDEVIERDLKKEIDQQQQEFNARQDERLRQEVAEAMRAEGLLDLSAPLFEKPAASPQADESTDTPTAAAE